MFIFQYKPIQVTYTSLKHTYINLKHTYISLKHTFHTKYSTEATYERIHLTNDR